MSKVSYSTIQDLPRSNRLQASDQNSSSQGHGSLVQQASVKEQAALPPRENIYANLIAKDQIQLWLPMLTSNL